MLTYVMICYTTLYSQLDNIQYKIPIFISHFNLIQFFKSI